MTCASCATFDHTNQWSVTWKPECDHANFACTDCPSPSVEHAIAGLITFKMIKCDAAAASHATVSDEMGQQQNLEIPMAPSQTTSLQPFAPGQFSPGVRVPSAVISPWLTRGYVRRNLGAWASPSVKLQNGVLGRSPRPVRLCAQSDASLSESAAWHDNATPSRVGDLFASFSRYGSKAGHSLRWLGSTPESDAQSGASALGARPQ